MNTMQYVIGGIFTGVAQACCWYQVFRCCGCIEDRKDPVIVIAATGQAKGQNARNPNPNPFLSPEAMRQWDMGSYSH